MPDPARTTSTPSSAFVAHYIDRERYDVIRDLHRKKLTGQFNLAHELEKNYKNVLNETKKSKK